MITLPTKKRELKAYLSTLSFEQLDLLYTEYSGSDDIVEDYIEDAIARILTREDKQAETKQKVKTYHQRLLDGTLNAYTIEQSIWDIEKTVDYICLEDYTTDKKVLVCADMGTGKNYCWTNSTVKHRLLAPLLSIVGQQGSSNNVNTDTTTTYDASKQLLGLIVDEHIEPENEILVVDEAHNFLLSKYRTPALSSVELLLSYNWKQIIFQSATVHSNDFDGLIEFDKKIRIHKNNKPILNYQRANKAKLSECFEEVIKFCAMNPYKTILLHNDKNKLVELQGVLEEHELKVEIVNADLTKQDGTVAKSMSKDVQFKMGDIDILIGTTSLVEGISIQDEIEIANAIVIGDEFPEFIKQLCGRIRKAKTINCLHLAANNRNNIILDIDLWLEEQRRNERIMYSHCAELKSYYNLYNKNDHFAHLKITGFDLEENGIYFNSDIGEYIKSPLSRLFQSATAKKKQFYSDLAYSEKVIKSLGFTIQQFIKYEADEEIQSVIKAVSKTKRLGLKEQRKQSAAPMLKLIKIMMKNGKSLDLALFSKEFSELVETRDTFQEDLLDVFVAVDASKLNFEQIETITQQMINGKLNKASIIKNTSAMLSEFGLMADLKIKYPKGAVLTMDEQKAALTWIVEALVQLTATANNMTNSEAFDFIMKQDAWYRSANNISYTNNQVQVSTKKVSSLLRNYLPAFETKRITTPTGKPTVIIIK